MMKRTTLWFVLEIILLSSALAWSNGFQGLHNELDRRMLERTTSQLKIGDAGPYMLPVDSEAARVTYFAGRGEERWVMIENTDQQSSRDYQLTFSKRITLFETSPVTGLERRRGRYTIFTFRLRPGGVALFRVTPRKEWVNMKPRVMLNPSVQYANVIRDESGAEIYNEGETMFDIAERVKAILDQDGHVDAYMSRMHRRANSTIQLECEIAQQLAVDAFVALHSDATADGSEGGGTWTFYADEDAKPLADCVQGNVLQAIREVYPEVQDRGVKEHWNRLYVLHNSGCPSSLTEILFHSNPKEREMLKDPTFQEKIAHAVAKGILDYFQTARPKQSAAK